MICILHVGLQFYREGTFTQLLSACGVGERELMLYLIWLRRCDGACVRVKVRYVRFRVRIRVRIRGRVRGRVRGGVKRSLYV